MLFAVKPNLSTRIVASPSPSTVDSSTVPATSSTSLSLRRLISKSSVCPMAAGLRALAQRANSDVGYTDVPPVWTWSTCPVAEPCNGRHLNFSTPGTTRMATGHGFTADLRRWNDPARGSLSALWVVSLCLACGDGPPGAGHDAGPVRVGVIDAATSDAMTDACKPAPARTCPGA